MSDYYRGVYEIAAKHRLIQQGPWWTGVATDDDDIIKYAEAKARVPCLK